MFNLKSAIAAISAAALMATASSASAAVITRTFEFSAHSFAASAGSYAPPVDPVVGSFTIQFDDAADVTDATSGITLNHLNIVLGSAIAYNYMAGFDVLEIGVAEGGGASVIYGGMNDFFLRISNASSDNPMFLLAAYSQAPTDAIWWTSSFETLPSAVPEPATWAMMIAGFGMTGTAIRRRRSAFAAA